ncbi:MAG: hypothetical protein Q9196_000315 [Gyalolechia fulgens]
MVLPGTSWSTLVVVFLAVALALNCAEVKGDADFESVRILMTEDSSGKDGDPRTKYWHESTFHPHYDGRFIDHELDYEDQRTNLTSLVQSYLSTMADLGAETWIFHGTLMGWWWNRKIMPWDTDIDVHVTEDTLVFLASYYNMTVHTVGTTFAPRGKKYMLEINPKYINPSPGDYLNTIDARWIDMLSGVFIDITAVHPKPKHPGAMFCKDGHRYREADLFPLRDSVFEDRPVKIPYNYAELLQEEYGRVSLTRTRFAGPTEYTASPPIATTSSGNSSGTPTNSAKSRQNTGSPPVNGTNGTSTVAQPNPRSCVTCRKRKVRCDKRHPCSNCNKAAIECVFPGPGRAPRRSRKPPDAELLARLRRLEGVVQHLGKNWDEEGEKSEEVAKDEPMPIPAADGVDSPARCPKQEETISKACGLFNGPEPRKQSLGGVSEEFGRLVVEEGRSRKQIAEMRDILDDPTEDEDDYPSPGSGSSASANNQGFIFGFSSTILSLRNFHPPANHIMRYWEVFKENVEPLNKVFHRPSVEKTLLEATKDLDHISKSLEVLMFSIYFAAVTSLCDEECMEMTGMDKESALKKYRFAFEQAMARAGFLSTTELVILQAFTVFLICVRRHDDTRFVWTLTGLLIRLAQSLGLHRDGEQFGLSPLETEMRRRLWWTLIHIDMRASEDHGSDPSILDKTFDTRFPLNINDEDINASMKEPPPEHEGATEMTFDLIRFTVSTTARRLSYTPPGRGKCPDGPRSVSLETKERLIEELHQHIEKKYLRHCDMNIPVHWVAGTVLRLVLAKMWLIVHHPLQREDFDSKELSEETKDRLFRTSVDIIQWSNILESEPSTKKWGWLFRTYVQWHAVVFVLSQLCIRTRGPEVDRAWQVIDEVISGMDVRLSGHKKGMLWKPIRKLIARARTVRARELEQLKMFPLDGSLGPAAARVGGIIDPARIDGSDMNFSMGHNGGNHGLPILDNPIASTTNGLPTYPPMEQSQPCMIDQQEWIYNDPAFPQAPQVFSMVSNNNNNNNNDTGNVDMASMNGMDASPNGLRSSGELNWSDWDEMMKDFAEGIQQDPGFGVPAASRPVMGGMTNWW